MTTGDKLLYFGVWGAAVGAGLFYGWRFGLWLLTPIVGGLATLFPPDSAFYSEASSVFIMLIADILVGLVISIILVVIAKLLLKPKTTHFVIVPCIVFAFLSYGWLIKAMLYESFSYTFAAGVIYWLGPVLVMAVYYLSFRYELKSRLTRHPS